MKNICSLISPFSNHNGVAKIGRNILKSFCEMNVPFSLVDLSNYYYNDPKIYENLIQRRIKSLSGDPILSNKIIFNTELEKFLKYNKYENSIPYFSIKYNSLPEKYINALKQINKIFVYNEFSRNVLKKHNICNNVFVIEPSIDCSLYKNNKTFKINKDFDFYFFTIIDCFKDKNWIDIINTYYETFSQKDNVCFIVKANDQIYSSYHQNNVARLIKLEKNKFNKKLPPILLITEPLTDVEIASIHCQSDCFVKIDDINSAISFVEAFAASSICIGPEDKTPYDILNYELNFAIKKISKKRENTNGVYKGLVYNKYDLNHLSDIMRHVVDNYSKLKEKKFKKRKIILSQFDQNVVGQKILQFLR